MLTQEMVSLKQVIMMSIKRKGDQIELNPAKSNIEISCFPFNLTASSLAD